MRKRRTLDRRAAVLRELDESSLSMAEFCRRRRLVYGTVAAWRSEQRRGKGSFVEVEIANEKGASSPVSSAANSPNGGLCAELLLPGGMVLRVFGPHDGGFTYEEPV